MGILQPNTHRFILAGSNAHRSLKDATGMTMPQRAMVMMRSSTSMIGAA